jgi:asparagine synthase (glutamine-hydrolysing)
MCGFVGCFDLRAARAAEPDLLVSMADTLLHRGPDSSGYFAEGPLGLGFRRLSIIDLAGGDQPLYNEDRSLVLVCNGEIYNHRELRRELERKGHSFRTNSDVEVLLHLYEEEGTGFLNRLNGQFAFALYDRRRKRLFMARDHFGINPLYYTVADGVLIFASEIKAILAHPSVERAVDLTGLDQVLTFPGMVSPRTLFKNIRSLKPGHHIVVQDGDFQVAEYWDLDFPQADQAVPAQPESYYVDALKQLLARSVQYRLQADVPVGFYLSGGLDSSLIAALIKEVSTGGERHSFSVGFTDRGISESKYQRLMTEKVGSVHHEITFDAEDIPNRLERMVFHAECPVKESYNTCNLALSEAASGAGIPVILTGEGADELFAGYVGYRFDRFRNSYARDSGPAANLEEELREALWGNRHLLYERDHHAFTGVKSDLYAEHVGGSLGEFNCLNFELVNKERLRGRSTLHQRSYLDFKLRLSDHLIADHGDKMALANSVEARYPFLDIDLVEFSTHIPAGLKLNDYTEKYILKRVAAGLVPNEIVNREKYGFQAPGSPSLLRQRNAWVYDMLSYSRIKRQGYFNPETIEKLKTQYAQENFKLCLPFEDDLLMIVLTFGIALDLFQLPSLN